MKRIGIYGGSFNPTHIGHTTVAQSICKAAGLDEVWFLVSPLNPLKRDKSKTILPTEIRIQLAELAVEGVSCLKVSDFETRLPIPSYTINTLVELKKAFPDCQFVLIVGGDNWNRFAQWYKSDEIKANHDIIVYGRNEVDDNHSDQSNHSSQAQVIIYHKDGTVDNLSENGFSFPMIDISSTQIRESFKTRNLPFAAKWLHPKVFRYILENGLYR